MDGFTSTCVDAIVGAFDLSSHRVAVDVGGMFYYITLTYLCNVMLSFMNR